MPRPFALMQTADQWRRAAHESTALDGNIVSLAIVPRDPAPGGSGPTVVKSAGLAFDAHCRLFHSLPETGQIERILWNAGGLAPGAAPPAAEWFMAALEDDLFGDFEAVAPAVALSEPRGLAIDEEDRLLVAEAGAHRILVYDLWSRRLLRRLPMAGRPIDLAAFGRRVRAVLENPAGLLEFEARGAARMIALPDGVQQPGRIAVSQSGDWFLLDRPGSASARVVPMREPAQQFVQPFATDLEFNGDGELVVALGPDGEFARYRIERDSRSALPALRGRGYDGRGIVRTPDGNIGFWTGHGFRLAVSARVSYVPEGVVTTYRLDSGQFQTRWGRVFLDACIPEQASVRVDCITADEPPEDVALERTPPSNLTTFEIRRPDLSPPMPPLSLVPPAVWESQRLHRRDTGSEQPWVVRAATDPFETYEAPMIAPPGRFLWLRIHLTGNSRVTPRIRSVRAEFPGHDLLRRLPKAFSREPSVADFLQRFLAIFEGGLAGLIGQSDARNVLIDPHAAPAELLPWLAGFVGLVFDERWPEAARRAAIAEAVTLFRFRGTIAGLLRFLEIYLGARPGIIEKWRLRGLGSAHVGEIGNGEAASIVGVGFRVGGSTDAEGSVASAGAIDDAFRTHAHRFIVFVPARLSSEQLDVVKHILEVHRPAHTLFDLCTVDSGMRIGRGLYLELTSVIGRSGSFRPMQIGSSYVGRGGIIGKPVAGVNLGAGHLGRETRLG